MCYSFDTKQKRDIQHDNTEYNCSTGESEMNHTQSCILRAVFAAVTAVFVTGTAAADSANNRHDYPQIIFVAAEGTKASVSMYEKKGDRWAKLFEAQGYVGRNGIGKTCEGDGKSPTGIFDLPSAFGIKDDPGTALPYQKVTEDCYWVDDSDSRSYNKMIMKHDAEADWKSGEHITDYPVEYAYAIVIGYNKECIRNAGSGIFLHCSANHPTSGCVSIPRENMVFLLRHIQPGCVISIGSADEIGKQIQKMTK
jgi:L,D-peptidoglycan transpeptidase YkuD (ErfK/YbiS/YcfS/YnhG family)